MHTWEHGIAFGQAIERIKHLALRADNADHRLDTLEHEVSHIKEWMKRGGIIATLWTGAVGANLAPDKVASWLKLIHAP